MKLLSIVIPVYNEEKTIIKCLENILKTKNDLNKIGYEFEIIISNDGSKDNSIKLTKEFFEKNKNIKNFIIDNKINKGKGHAVKEGIKKSKGDLIIIQDADLEYFPQDYIPMIKKLENKKLDIIFGSRTKGFLKFKNNYSSISFFLGGLLMSIITTILTFTLVSDEPTCYKLFSSKLKKYLLCINENGFNREPAATVLLLKKGFKYGEVPIHYKARKINEGKKIKWKDGIEGILTLIKRRFKKCNI